MKLIKSYYETKIEDVNQHLKTGILKVKGLEVDSVELYFYCKDGFVICMYHEQDCCEDVFLESADSIENKVDIYTDCDWCELEEISDVVQPQLKGYYNDSFTWTFYKVKTNKGYDTIRWYGSSNGYYSESVDFKIYHEEDYIGDLINKNLDLQQQNEKLKKEKEQIKQWIINKIKYLDKGVFLMSGERVKGAIEILNELLKEVLGE